MVERLQNILSLGKVFLGVYHFVLSTLLLTSLSLALSLWLFLTAQYPQTAPKPVMQHHYKVSDTDATIKIHKLTYG